MDTSGRTSGLLGQLEVLRSRLARSPGDASIALEIAALWERIGDLSEAFGVLDRAQELAPSPELVEAIRRLRARPTALPAPSLHALEVGADPKGHREVACLAFDPAARRLAIGTRGGDLWFQDLSAGTAGDRRPEGPPIQRGRVSRGVSALAFLPGGRHLVSGGGDQTVRVWETEGEAKAEVVARDLEAYVLGVSGYRGAFCGASTENIWVRDAEGVESTTWYGIHGVLPPHRGWVQEATIAAQVQRFSHGYPGNGPSRPGAPIVAVYGGLGGHRVSSRSSPFLVGEPTGTVVGILVDGRVEVLSPDGPAPGQVHEHPAIHPALRGFQDELPVAQLAPEGSALLVGSLDPEIGGEGWEPPYTLGARLFVLSEEVRAVELVPGAEITAVAFSPCGRQLALGARSGEVWAGTWVGPLRA